jgi:hypothetical protein
MGAFLNMKWSCKHFRKLTLQLKMPGFVCFFLFGAIFFNKEKLHVQSLHLINFPSNCSKSGSCSALPLAGHLILVKDHGLGLYSLNPIFSKTSAMFHHQG